jgi:arsenical pump membrane protein
VANAASLVLPIANPSNLVFFAGRMPHLAAWFGAFGLASIAAVVLTYAGLALAFRRAVRPALVVHDGVARAPRPLAGAVLVLSALALVIVSMRSGPLGITTFALGALALLLSATRERRAPLAIARGIAWPVVIFAAALFVVVDALDAAGAASLPRALFGWAAQVAAPAGQLGVALASAFASNVATNLPVGLDLGKYAGIAHPPAALSAAALVGVNVGPNFTANGSLATILWLAILRRAGMQITPLRFAVVGCFVTPPALCAAALLAR